MLSFLGLNYARGLCKRNEENVTYLYRSPSGNPLFSAVMSESRFRFLQRMITFDDKNTRKNRHKSDRFAAFREIFEMFNDNCSRGLNTDGYICIDETLYPSRQKISFRQYDPMKPARYGILIKSINSVLRPFTHRIFVYAGKPEGTPGEYYITDIIPVVKSLICGLSALVPLEGNNLTVDKRHTSLELLHWLLSERITIVGTMMTNKKEIPVEMKSVSAREHKSYKAYRNEDDPRVILHSYAVRTESSGMKNNLIMSSLSAIPGVIKDDGLGKPAIYKFYDFTKGGTDIANQRMSYYTTNTKSGRWTLTMFSYVLDIARSNAQTVFALNMGRDPRKLNSYEFGYDLVMELVLPQIRRRHTNPSVRKSTKDKMNMFLDLKPFLVFGSQQAPTSAATHSSLAAVNSSLAVVNSSLAAPAVADHLNSPLDSLNVDW